MWACFRTSGQKIGYIDEAFLRAALKTFLAMDMEFESSANTGNTGYTDLNVWKEARALVKVIYDYTGSFPDEEKTGLTSQMRSTAISVPAKIAEGAGRKQAKHSLKYLFDAKSALFELETLVYIASDLGYMAEYSASELIEKIITARKLLFGYIRFKERKANDRGEKL